MTFLEQCEKDFGSIRFLQGTCVSGKWCRRCFFQPQESSVASFFRGVRSAVQRLMQVPLEGPYSLSKRQIPADLIAAHRKESRQVRIITEFHVLLCTSVPGKDANGRYRLQRNQCLQRDLIVSALHLHSTRKYITTTPLDDILE